jgi:hypothetical protein
MPFSSRETPSRQQQPQRTTLRGLMREEETAQSSLSMSMSISTNHGQSITVTDEDSVQVSSDGESPPRNGFSQETDFPDIDVLPPMNNMWRDNHQHEDSDFPDVEILPPLMSGPSGWMESSEDFHRDSDSDFPDVESLPPPMNFSSPSSAMSLLLTQNDREDMRLQSKQRAIEDISRNFRCHRPQCENDANSISNPRLRRQQVWNLSSLPFPPLPLTCSRSG